MQKNDDETMKKKKIEKIIFAFIVIAIGVIIKVLMWRQTPYLSRDSITYLEYAIFWKENGCEFFFANAQTFFPPLYIFLVQYLMQYGVEAEKAALSINITLGAFIPLILFYIVSNTTKKKLIAYIALAFALFHPEINKLSIEAQRDIGYLFLLSLFLLTMILGFRSFYLFAVSGIILAAAILFRFEAVELIPLTALSLWLFKSKQGLNKNIIAFLFLLCFTLFGVYVIGYLIGLSNDNFSTIFRGYKNQIDLLK